MSSASSIMRVVAVGAIAVLAYGVLLGALWGGLHWVFDGPLPKWIWWQYIVAAFGIGLVALVAEAAFSPLGRVLIDADRTTDSKWKRSLRVLGILAFGVFLLALGVLLRENGIL